MAESDIIQYFRTYAPKVWGKAKNDYDVQISTTAAPYIPYVDAARKFYELKTQEILFHRDRSGWLEDRKPSCVITEKSICWLDEEDGGCILNWSEVENVEFKGTQFIFYLRERTDTGGYQYVGIDGLNFYKTNPPQQAIINNLVKFFSKIVELAAPEEAKSDIVIDEIDKNEDNPQKIIDIALDAVEDCPDIAGYLNFEIGRNYYRLDKFSQAIRYLKAADGNTNVYFQTWINLLLGELLANNPSKVQESRNHRLLAAKGDSSLIIDDSDEDENEENISAPELALNELEQFDINYFSNIESHPHAEHKLIYAVPSIADLSTLAQNQMMVTTVNVLRNAHLAFDMGHPVAKQLYVAHPYNRKRLIPFENYELEFIEDRVREFCAIAASLGATEISIKAVNTEDVAEETKADANISAHIDTISASGQAGLSGSVSNKLLTQLSRSIGIHQELKPINRPSLPPKDELVWFDHEPRWQRLVKQRLSGSLLRHSERIDTRSSRVVEGSAMLDLQGEIQSVYADLGMHFTADIASRYETQTNAVLEINVEFHPIDANGDLACNHVDAQPDDIHEKILPDNETIENRDNQENATSLFSAIKKLFK